MNKVCVKNSYTLIQFDLKFSKRHISNPLTLKIEYTQKKSNLGYRKTTV
jgi:hypothetical protein